MTKIHPYLNFNGNTEEAFHFYQSVFGGEFAAFTRFSDYPESSEDLPLAERNGMMHIALPIGESVMLMGTDIPSIMPQVVPGSNISIAIAADSKEEADRLFAGLSKNGTISVPLEKMSWGDYFGMLTDQFDIQWMVSFNENG